MVFYQRLFTPVALGYLLHLNKACCLVHIFSPHYLNLRGHGALIYGDAHEEFSFLENKNEDEIL